MANAKPLKIKVTSLKTSFGPSAKVAKVGVGSSKSPKISSDIAKFLGSSSSGAAKMLKSATSAAHAGDSLRKKNMLKIKIKKVLKK